MTRTKGAVRVAFVRNCEINCAVLSERLCRLFVDACSEAEFCNMLILNGGSITVDDRHQLESATLQNFLLSLNIGGSLNWRGSYRRGDFTRAFLLRCTRKGIQTLHARWHNIDLQRMQPEEAEGVVQALNQGV